MYPRQGLQNLLPAQHLPAGVLRVLVRAHGHHHGGDAALQRLWTLQNPVGQRQRVLHRGGVGLGQCGWCHLIITARLFLLMT